MLKVAPILAAIVIMFSSANAASLTNDQRRAFLEYYAPIIFKRGNENDGEIGRDWVTQYDFDRDFAFADNKREWRDLDFLVDQSAIGANNARFNAWRLRPTIYTALIEYTDGGIKNLVLIYQIYHAMQETAEPLGPADIHDYERIDIHIKNVAASGTPNSGEIAAYAAITQHGRSVLRNLGSPDFNFFTTSTGKHLMIWQAEHTGKLTGPHGNELRYVQDSSAQIFSEMASNISAEVEILGADNDKNVHYIFVPRTSSGAVSAFGAKYLNYESAAALASGKDNGFDVRWRDVKRIGYELQDLVDVFSTGSSGSRFTRHWEYTKTKDIFITEGFSDPEGIAIGTGLQRFYTKTKDVELVETDVGFLEKTWFWGADEYRDVCNSTCSSTAREFADKTFASTAVDSRGNTRSSANGDAYSAGRYFRQHDYFVHTGQFDLRDGFEAGFYLTNGWHTAARGGFDGRWANLFPDSPTTEDYNPLSISTRIVGSTCQEYQLANATASGGRLPYTFQWTQFGSVIRTTSGVRSSSTGVYAFDAATVKVTDGRGVSRQATVYINQQCGPNEFPY